MKQGLRRWQLALMLCVMSSLQAVFAAPVLVLLGSEAGASWSWFPESAVVT
jgi:hypothetical protein